MAAVSCSGRSAQPGNAGLCEWIWPGGLEMFYAEHAAQVDIVLDVAVRAWGWKEKFLGAEHRSARGRAEHRSTLPGAEHGSASAGAEHRSTPNRGRRGDLVGGSAGGGARSTSSKEATRWRWPRWSSRATWWQAAAAGGTAAAQHECRRTQAAGDEARKGANCGSASFRGVSQSGTPWDARALLSG